MRRPALRVLFSLLAFAGLFSFSAPSQAQSDTGLIVVTITDAKTGKPLANARAILFGTQVVSTLTTANGVIRYTDAPTGLYRLRVMKQGYAAAASPQFEVLDGRMVSLDVKLTETAAPGGTTTNASGLKIIGTVIARSQVDVTSHDISDDSPIRRISDSLTDALDKLAGVSITQDATDPNSAQTISLNNHDESQTAVTLDGIPLGAPGSAVNLRSVNTDLFSGASASFGPTAGSLGGGVNFRTLQPTKSWIETLAGSYGTFDRATYQIAETGSFGNLGVALMHTFRNGNNPLTFQDYEDESGLRYPHGGEFSNLGDFGKLRYSLGDGRTTIMATGLDANNWNNSICTQITGALPCGIGPNNQNYSAFRMGYITVQSVVGEVAGTVSAYSTGSSNTADDINRYINGTNAPSLNVNGSNTRGIAYSFSISPGAHTITLSGNTYAALQTTTPVIGTSTGGGTINFQTPFTNGVSADTYQLGDLYKLNNWLSVGPSLSLANTTGAGSSVLFSGNVQWRPQINDAIGFSMGYGSSQPGTNVNRSFSDPASARIDCQSGVVTVSGPGDLPQHQSALNVDLNWTHKSKYGQFSADVFRQTQTGQLITALVNSASEPAGYFAPGFLTAIANNYSGPDVCGAGATFNQANLYVQEPIGGTARLYQGVNLSGRFGIGRNFVALPTYSINEAVLTQADALLLGAASTTIVGAQLPNRPLHRAGLTVDGYLPHSGIELLANAQYTGPNNQQNLPSYIVATAGIAHAFGPGMLTLFESNIFNQFGYEFASNTYGVPLPLNGGGTLPTIGRPLSPRQLNATYRMKLGAPAPSAAFKGVATLAQSQPAASPTPRGFRLNLATPPPGADPLSVATGRESCTVDDAKLAAPVLAEIKTYATAYEAKRTPPEFKDIEISAHQTTDGTSYYLQIRPKFVPGPNGQGQQRVPGAGGPGGPRQRGGEGGAPVTGGEPGGGPGGPIIIQSQQPNPQAQARFRQLQANPLVQTFRAFLGCSYLTALTTDEAKAKGVVQERGRGPGMFYAPGTGLFVVRPPTLPAGGGSLGGGK